MRIRNFTAGKFLLPALALAFLTLAPAALAQSNRTVFVEGNCGDGTVGRAGACGDYDKDGTIGADENIDGDNVYNSINAALAALNGENGRVLVVTSGTFSEPIVVSLTTGHVQIEAAEGVEANIDAVRFLNHDGGNSTREGGIGLLLSGQPGSSFTLRNLTVRNWLIGMRVSGSVRLMVEHCRFDNNLNYGIQMLTSSRITMNDSQIAHTGRRKVASNDPAPAPGTGIQFADTTGGYLNNSRVVDSVGFGLQQTSAFNVVICHMVFADNAAGNTTGPGPISPC